MVLKSVCFSMMLYLLCMLSACSSANNKPLCIGFSADSTAIVFKDIDPAGLLQLQQLPAGDTTLKRLFSVTRPGALDTSLREQMLPGKFKLTDQTLLFIPDQPFVKGSNYLVSSYLNLQPGSFKKMLRGELNYHTKPVQRLLKR